MTDNSNELLAKARLAFHDALLEAGLSAKIADEEAAAIYEDLLRRAGWVIWAEGKEIGEASAKTLQWAASAVMQASQAVAQPLRGLTSQIATAIDAMVLVHGDARARLFDILTGLAQQVGMLAATSEGDIGETVKEKIEEAEESGRLGRKAIEDEVKKSLADLKAELPDLMETTADIVSWGMQSAVNAIIPSIEGLAANFGATLLGGIKGTEAEGSILSMDIIKKLRESDRLPDEVKPLLDAAENPQNPFVALVLSILVVPILHSIISVVFSGGLVQLQQEVNKKTRPALLDTDTIRRAWLRGLKTPGAEWDLWEDARESGLSEDRINIQKQLSFMMPPPQDIIRWAAREVFEPEQREKLGLDQFLPPQYLEWAAKVGITDEVAANYWAAHWELPSLTSIIELYRRGEIGDAEVETFWTQLDMTPFWRTELKKLFAALPTRVDVRRWWDMRTIDESRLRQLYHSMGYFGEDLEDYVTWTKVYTAFPDLVARYKNGWIPLDGIKGELVAMGVPEARAGELLETKFRKPVAIERVQKERDLTKSEIIKGAKKQIISLDHAHKLLTEMGYDASEASYIIAINIETEGSPETPLEFQQLVDKYRRTQGMAIKEYPPEVLEAEKAFITLETQLKAAHKEGASQDAIDYLETQKALAQTTLELLLQQFELST